MRKTLLIAAAALAAGVISSEAGVYSQNIVGYVNIPVPNNSYQLVANQLDTGSNTLDNVFQSGAVSSDTTVLYWTGTAFQQYIYYNSGDFLMAVRVGMRLLGLNLRRRIRWPRARVCLLTMDRVLPLL